MFGYQFFHLFSVLLLCHESVGLRLTNMTAPSIQDPRHEMQLYCKFDMGGEDLYAVKWYKDDHEFYRYAPSGPTNYVQYPVPGVTVDTNRSHCTRDTCELWLVALQRPYSSGAYRCEVSSEAPAFRLASQTYNITVAVIPKNPPQIEQLSDSYSTGALLVAICTSGMGDPKPRLTWYVNKELVPLNQVKELPSKSVADNKNNNVVLKNAVSKLTLTLDKKLTGTEPSTSFEIKCVSSTDGINPNIAPHLSTTRNIMIIDENQLVNNQKLHWPSSSQKINSVLYLPILTMIMYLFVC
ncbi:uncharacterized protein LOC109600798 [Aethina tumida]|uniref:uncharacterized protein LOC109600798 n=1 Tax=Aethina tumida TaxID=116153 RepID=UPI002147CDE3|nr:uncharacterized protein LOC109600798 [Aethina tumida]